jgi:hypothetical protein
LLDLAAVTHLLEKQNDQILELAWRLRQDGIDELLIPSLANLLSRLVDGLPETLEKTP